MFCSVRDSSAWQQGKDGTLEGKKRASLNAFRHGLTGQIVIHTPEDEQAFKTHCDGIREALAPVGALEIDLAQAIAEDRWRLNRARALENSVFVLGQSEHFLETSGDPEFDTAIAQGRTWMAQAGPPGPLRSRPIRPEYNVCDRLLPRSGASAGMPGPVYVVCLRRRLPTVNRSLHIERWKTGILGWNGAC
jgi:hypothetical protein